MNSILIQQKARDLRMKTRQQRMAAFIVPFAVLFCYLFCIRQFSQLGRGLPFLFAVAFIWSLIGLYFLNGGTRPGDIPDEAGFSSGLDFCLREMDRQRQYYGRVLLWSFGPILLAIGAVILTLAIVAGADFLRKAMPFVLLVTLWVASYFVIWMRKRRKLQLEFDELHELEKSSV